MSFDEFIQHSTSQLANLTAMVQQLQNQVNQLKQGERMAYNLQEAAELTGIGYETLYNRCRSGQIQYSQTSVGGSIIVTRAELERYINETCTGQPQRMVEAETLVRAVRSRKSSLRITHQKQAAKGSSH